MTSKLHNESICSLVEKSTRVLERCEFNSLIYGKGKGKGWVEGRDCARYRGLVEGKCQLTGGGWAERGWFLFELDRSSEEVRFSHS